MPRIPRNPNCAGPDGQGNPTSVLGHWHFEDFWATDPPTRIVVFACPGCGRGATIWRPEQPPGCHHSIDAAGNVTPSAVCPHQGCAYHEFITLEGWSFGPRPG